MQMLSKEELLVLDLLNISLKKKEICADINIDDSLDLDSLTGMILRNGILLTVFPTICRISSLSKLKNYLEMAFLHAIAQETNQRSEGEEILLKFNENGIDSLPLKGWEIGKLYPKKHMRSMADIDILIKNYNYNNIKKILNEMGYESQGSSSWKHDNFYKGNVTIEIHKRLTDDSDQIQKWENTIWLNASCTGHLYRMSSEDFFIHHMIHMYEDFRNGSLGLRRIVDTWLLSERKMNSEYLDEVFSRFGITVFVKRMIELAYACFGALSMDAEKEFLIHHAFVNGIYGTDKTYKISRIVAMSKNGLFSGKFHSYFAALFLPYDRMKAHFPILKKYPILLPLCWGKRILHYVTKSPELVQRISYRNITEGDFTYMKTLFKAGGIL